MTALVLAARMAQENSRPFPGGRFHVTPVSSSPPGVIGQPQSVTGAFSSLGVIGKPQPFAGASSSPGVIGEGRKITKTSHLTPQSFSSISPEPRQHVNDDVNNNFNFNGANKMKSSKRQPSAQAMQIVAKQQHPHQTVPQVAAPNYLYSPSEQLWQQGCASDDHVVGQQGFEQSMFDSNHFPRQSRIPVALSEPVLQQQNSDDEDDDDADGKGSHHFNTFPVEIEHHSSKQCLYRRQQSKSGYMRKFVSPVIPGSEPMQIKYYRKDLVRVCKCNSSPSREAILQHGMEKDMDGYEIHYSQKCKWKAYDDYKTGKRVLIRLCKCYRPAY